METIKIAHLYYDLLNLYGENGNVKALTKHLEHHNVKVITHFLTVDDPIDFNKYDIFYIGSGNKENFEIAREDIMKRKKDIKKIWQEKLFIATGNGIDLFGKNFVTLDDKTEKCLDLLHFEARETDFRIVGESIAHHENLTNEIIGFQNRFSVLKNVQEPPLFQMIDGTGHAPKIMEEGIMTNNFLGTYLLGPILIRNPHLTEFIIKKLLEKKELPYQEYQDFYEIKAYEEYQKNLNANEKAAF
ncbi:MAG: hypothetical protein HFI08_04845 [Bacilli bacterium]|jgi:hypothetical protein|nr:hypothetical protein [Bacilli bacterium]